MKKFYFLFPIVCLLLTVAVFYYKSIFFGQIPAPTDTLVGLYHPWRDLYKTTNPRGVPFKNFLITDPIRQQIPWRKIALDQWKTGNLPAWNPYSFLGVPLAANIQTGAYQPLNVLFTIFKFPVAWSLLIILQSFFTAFFLYIYLRNLNVSALSAYVGAIVWAFCGFSIAWLTWGTIVWTAAFLPLLLYRIDRLCTVLKDKNESLISIGVASLWVGLSGVLMIVSGHAQIALYGFVVSILYGVYRFWGIANRMRVVLFTVISVSVLLFGSYMVWQPFVRFYLETSRSTPINLSGVAGWLLPPQHLLQFIAPDFFGNPATLNYWGAWNYGEFIGYIGIVPLVLAVSALFLGGVATFWSVILVISFVLMIESPLTHALYSMRIPIFSSLQPTRLMVLVDLSLAILSAFGLETLLAKKITRIHKSYAVISVLFLIVLSIILYLGKTTTDSLLIRNIVIARRNLVVPITLLISFGGLLWINRVVKRLGRRVLIGIIMVVSMIDLFRFGWKFTPFTPSDYFFPQTKIISFLQAQPKPFRIMSLDDRILPPNVNAYYGIESIEGYDPLYPKDYTAFLYGGDTGSKTTLQRIVTLHDLTNPAFPYLNVRYVLSLSDIDNPEFEKVFEEGETKVYQYMKALPRAYLDSQDNVSKREILLSEFVSITSYSDNALTIQTSSTVSGTLVVLNRYDAGWHALLDDMSVQVLKVKTLFQGVPITEGRHTIKLWYQAL